MWIWLSRDWLERQPLWSLLDDGLDVLGDERAHSRTRRQPVSAIAAVSGESVLRGGPRRSGATREEPPPGWFLPWGALRTVLNRTRFQWMYRRQKRRMCIRYGLVPLVMRRGGSFDCEAFDRLYYGTNGLGYEGYWHLVISPPKHIAARSNHSRYQTDAYSTCIGEGKQKDTRRSRMWRKRDLDAAVPVPAFSSESNHYVHIVDQSVTRKKKKKGGPEVRFSTDRMFSCCKSACNAQPPETHSVSRPLVQETRRLHFSAERIDETRGNHR
ncbi:hypothetical protein V8E53_005161 [Lactarius tabidus]